MLRLTLTALLLALTPISALAQQASPKQYLLDSLQSCSLSQLDQNQSRLSEQHLQSAATCMADHAIAGAFGFTQDLLDRQGKALFGQGFSIQSSFDYSLSSSSGIQGNLDVVVPVYSFSSSSSDATPLRSGFLQNGITRWVDERGIQRSDARMGVVYRFTAGQNRANMFGLSALLQKNLEFDHQRLATGVDYAGIWGVASLTYFKPITDWQFNHLGYKERPLEGMDFDMQLKPTTAILFRTTVGRWKDPEGSGNWLTRGRVALEWQPHPYLKFGIERTGIGTEREAQGVHVSVRIPLGGPRQNRVRWQGLGRRLNKSTHAPNIWRPVDHVQRLEYERRALTDDEIKAWQSAAIIKDSRVRFLQPRATSGATIKLEVSLTTPAPEDALLVVEFSPGDGDNPAVPGEDYTDEPIEIWIRKGESRAIAAVQMPLNPNMSSGRALKATVTSATLQAGG